MGFILISPVVLARDTSTRLCSRVDKVPEVEILSNTIAELLLMLGSSELATLSMVRQICWPQVEGAINKATPIKFNSLIVSYEDPGRWLDAY